MATKQTTKVGDPIAYKDWNGPVYGTSEDPILAKAKKDHPPTPEEVAAEAAVEAKTAEFNTFLRDASRRMRDIGTGFGDIASGFGFMDDRLKAAYDEVREALEKALVRRNSFVAERHAKIRAQVEREEAVEAQKAQKEYQRKLEARQKAAEGRWQPFRPLGR